MICDRCPRSSTPPLSPFLALAFSSSSPSWTPHRSLPPFDLPRSSRSSLSCSLSLSLSLLSRSFRLRLIFTLPVSPSPPLSAHKGDSRLLFPPDLERSYREMPGLLVIYSGGRVILARSPPPPRVKGYSGASDIFADGLNSG